MEDDFTTEFLIGEDDRAGTVLDPKVVTGLVEQVVNLDPPASEEILDDLAELWEVFVGRKIIGLGEAAHGGKEFFQLQHWLLRFLVQDLGIRAIGLEANFPETLAINKFIRHGGESPEAALKNTYVWTWRTQEVLNFIKWLRAFNTGRPPEDQVGIYGFDMQKSKGAAEALADYLDKVHPEYLTEIREDLALLANPGLGLGTAEGRERRIQAVDRIVPDMGATLEERRRDYVARGSKREWKLARQHTTVLSQAAEFGKAIQPAEGRFNMEAVRVRERAMAENISWILDFASTDCVAVCAHNDHVNRVKTPIGSDSEASMGNHLSRWYDEAYYALGFEFGSGTFQAFVESDAEEWEYEVQECNIDVPLSDTVTGQFSALDSPVAFLDFRTATDNSTLGNWLEGDHQLHSIGLAYNPTRPGEYVQTWVLADAYDGLCYVDEITPKRLLDQV